MNMRTRLLMALVPTAMALSVAGPALADEHDTMRHNNRSMQANDRMTRDRVYTERTYRLYEVRPVSPELQALQNFYGQSVTREAMIEQQWDQFRRAQALPLSETWGRMAVDQMILSSRARQLLRAHGALPTEYPMFVASAGNNVSVMFDALSTPLPQQTTQWRDASGTVTDPNIRDLFTEASRTYDLHNQWIGNARQFVGMHPMYVQMVAGLRQEIQPLTGTNQDLLRRFYESNFTEAHHMAQMANTLKERGETRVADVFAQIAAEHSRSAATTMNLMTQAGATVPKIEVMPMDTPRSRNAAINHALDMHRAQLPMARQWAAQADNPTAKGLLQQGVMTIENHIRMLEDLRR